MKNILKFLKADLGTEISYVFSVMSNQLVPPSWNENERVGTVSLSFLTILFT